MDPINLGAITGTVSFVEPSSPDCKTQRITLSTGEGLVNIDIAPTTYIAEHTQLLPEITMTAFYDTTQPVPLIYPPQYQAVAATALREPETAAIQYFDESLTAADNSLRLNLAPYTRVVTANGQFFPCSPGGHTLMVYYDKVTKSNPPLASPRKIIVF